MGSDPDILVDMTTAANAFEAEVIVEALRAQGVPAEAFTIAGSMLQWDIAGTQPFRVAVRRRDLGRAAQVLRELKADSVDIAWDELNPGSPETEADNPETSNARLLWRVLWIALGTLLIVTGLLGRWRS